MVQMRSSSLLPVSREGTTGEPHPYRADLAKRVELVAQVALRHARSQAAHIPDPVPLTLSAPLPCS